MLEEFMGAQVEAVGSHGVQVEFRYMEGEKGEQGSRRRERRKMRMRRMRRRRYIKGRRRQAPEGGQSAEARGSLRHGE